MANKHGGRTPGAGRNGTPNARQRANIIKDWWSVARTRPFDEYMEDFDSEREETTHELSH